MGRASSAAFTHAEEIAALLDAVLIDEYPGVGALIDELHRRRRRDGVFVQHQRLHWPKLVHHDGKRPLPG